jgi:hypothetical protein
VNPCPISGLGKSGSSVLRSDAPRNLQAVTLLDPGKPVIQPPVSDPDGCEVMASIIRQLPLTQSLSGVRAITSQSLVVSISVMFFPTTTQDRQEQTAGTLARTGSLRFVVGTPRQVRLGEKEAAKHLRSPKPLQL